MNRILARSLSAAALSVVAAGGLGAQGLQGTGLIVAPHYTQYTIGSGLTERTINQMAVPFVVLMPFSERFSMDITTAFANTQVKTGTTESTISGLTDTQIRGNFTVGDQMLVFTVGLNLPSGQYSVAPDQVDAAGQIGNDFLNYPISSMGNGLGGTGGIAFAKALGSWNLGLGASMRKSTEFSAFTQASSDFRFTPADEYRVRVGLDRPVGDGQVQLGVAYSAYGADAVDTTAAGNDRTTASTGDRLTVNGMWALPMGGGDLYLSVWDLYRMEGERFDGVAPPENVANVNVAYSMEVGSILVQPSVEGRFWQVDGTRAGQLTNLNVRLRFGAGSFALFPSVGYSMGTLYDVTSGAASDVSGLRGSLTIRFN